MNWWKKTGKDWSRRGVARAALHGASRTELLHEAVEVLSRHDPSQRIGVWLALDSQVNPLNAMAAGFHGLVWDHGSTETPQPWAHLSVEPPLPDEQLLRGKTVEQDLHAFPPNSILGLLEGLRHALWVPIHSGDQLHGIVFAGSVGKQSAISRECAEAVAADLALALVHQEEQKIARRGDADLGLVRRFLTRQAAGSSPDSLLSQLVESCTESLANGTGSGASFAVIGELRQSGEASSDGFPIHFHWRSGDELWTHAMDSEPLANVWQRALEARRVIGSQSDVVRIQGSVARIIAFPLESDGQLLGTLVAGMPEGAASLATLERLELRAVLAASILQQIRRTEEESRLAGLPNVLLDRISEPLFLLDGSGKVAGASRGARKLTGPHPKNNGLESAGIPAHTYLPELFRGRDHTDIEAWLQAGLGRAKEKHGVLQETSRAELHNGVEVRLSFAATGQGQPSVVLLERITPLDSPEQPGRAEIELQSVIEWLEEGVVLFDAQNNIRAMNTRFEQIAGLAPEDSGQIKTLEGLIGRLGNQAAEPVRFTEQWRELARGIEGGVREELQIIHPSPRILERAARPVLDPIGRLLGRVEVYRDLTAQRAFHSKLLQTEKLAALGQMVSGIAHELSNPLTSILGYAHRLLARQDLPGRTEEVRQIYQEAERAGDVLRQLLLNARESLPERRLVSLNQIVQRSMGLQRYSLATEKIRVETDLDPALPFVRGDPGHLQQVLMNLMGNARQAIEQHSEGGTIRLRTKGIGERRVLLEIADNGPGIPQSILARIFDPFFTTKPAGVGTGLGLAIVLSVVREHGGQVHVSSPPQGGAVFQVELPAASEMALDEALGSPFPGREEIAP